MMWKDYELPSFFIDEGKKIYINTGWTNIIEIFKLFNSDDLLPTEKAECLFTTFYQNARDITDFDGAFDALILFINGNKQNEERGVTTEKEPKLVDWEKDLRLIIPPVNKVLGYDVRERPDLHWWTFLGAFNEIGECTFQTYVNIRSKLASRKKLENYEKEIYRKHKNEINIVKAQEYDNFDDEDILMQLARKDSEFIIET